MLICSQRVTLQTRLDVSGGHYNIDLTAEECIVFEDTESGIGGAQCGIDVIVVDDRKKRNTVIPYDDSRFRRLPSYQEF